MSIVITGATGNVGGHALRHLLQAGAEVTVLVRNASKLPEDMRQRVRVAEGALEDAAFVREATRNAAALLWVSPGDIAAPDMRAWYERLAESAAEAVRVNTIPRVVNISSAGADQATGLGLISCLQSVENGLNAVAENVLHLRPNLFMENLRAQVEAIRSQRSIFHPAPTNTLFSMIATRDIGAVAAQRLQDDTWTGRQILGLHGPAELSHDEAAEILSDVLKTPVRAVQISAEQERQTFLSMGASRDFADRYVEMFEGLGRGIRPAEPRTLETTTPTTLAQFAREELLPLLESGGAVK